MWQVLDAAETPPAEFQGPHGSRPGGRRRVPGRVLGAAVRMPNGGYRRTAIDDRIAEQTAILNSASAYVRPSGFLAYVTCSLFPAENEDRVYDFLERNPDFEIVSAGEVWQDVYGFDKQQPWSADMMSITLTPASTDTDGFYFAVMERAGN